MIVSGAPDIVCPGHVWAAWSWEPGAIAALGVSAVWYGLGVRALWRRAGRGRGVRVGQVACFAAGLATLGIALVSPLDALAETLFSVHMVQHLVLLVVAPPLLVLGEPLLPALWALPARTRHAAGRWWHASPRARRTVHVLTDPLGVWLAHLAVLWFWHLPGPYALALRHDGVHVAEHLCFLGTALLFWWVVLQPIGRRRLAPAGAVVLLTLTMMQSGALGVILTFARTPWYPVHAAGVAAWHVSLIEDQQLAGLIMSVPASLVYVGAALALAARWFRDAPAPRARPRFSPG